MLKISYCEAKKMYSNATLKKVKGEGVDIGGTTVQDPGYAVDLDNNGTWDLFVPKFLGDTPPHLIPQEQMQDFATRLLDVSPKFWKPKQRRYAESLLQQSSSSVMGIPPAQINVTTEHHGWIYNEQRGMEPVTWSQPSAIDWPTLSSEASRLELSADQQNGNFYTLMDTAAQDWISGNKAMAVKKMQFIIANSGGAPVSYITEVILCLGDPNLAPILQNIANLFDYWVGDEASNVLIILTDPTLNQAYQSCLQFAMEASHGEYLDNEQFLEVCQRMLVLADADLANGRTNEALAKLKVLGYELGVPHSDFSAMVANQDYASVKAFIIAEIASLSEW